MAEPKRPKFMTRDARPRMARDEDFAALFERDLAARPSVPQEVAIARIRPNPFQARTSFEGIEELAESMRLHGFTSRLRLRRDPGDPRFFQLVFGERRLRAAKAAGMEVVPCDVADHSDEELIEIGLTENIQRRDLGPLEEANAFRALIDQRRYTHAQLAQRIGKDRSYVEDRLALLRVPEDVQALVARRPDTLRAAREIAKVENEADRRSLIADVAAGALSQHAVRALVREAVDPEAAQRKPAAEHGAIPHATPVAKPDRLGGNGGVDFASTNSRFERALERDAAALRVMCARWRQALRGLSEHERGSLLRCIHDHLGELEELSDALRREDA